MEESIYKRNRHAVYDLKYHLVVVTKYRHPVLVDNIRKRLLEITDELLKKWNVELLSIESTSISRHRLKYVLLFS